MGYVYATINKDTLAQICKEKGVSSEFLASKTKLNMSRLNQWLTPTDINLPTINQAKKIAACLHMLPASDATTSRKGNERIKEAIRRGEIPGQERYR